MLILTRKPRQRIFLERNGERIEVLVSHVSGDQVNLGFTAGRDWIIHREEVYERIRSEKEQAA